MEFDYVIIGAGSAGCVLAARLSEQPDSADSAWRHRPRGDLRVIDASVMPTLVSVNTNAATTMIAEHGAELIRAGV